jgi:hypothetical protein
MIWKMVENLPVRSGAVLILGTKLFPSKVENGVIYFRNVLLVGSQPSLLDNIFYIN